jgi:hypothetical protein
MIAYELVVEAGIGAAATVTAGAASALTAARLALIVNKLKKLGPIGDKVGDLLKPTGPLAQKLGELFSQLKKGGRIEDGVAPSSTAGRIVSGGCFVPGTPVRLCVEPAMTTAAVGRDTTTNTAVDTPPITTTTTGIENVALGERVPDQNPRPEDYDFSLRDVDQETWRQIDVRLRRKDGNVMEMQLLRPVEWVKNLNLRVGGEFKLILSEFEVDGNAVVTAIGRCCEIAGGEGSVVTGRFVTRQVSNLIEVTLEDGTSFTGTATHPVWIPAKHDWIELENLKEGESLEALAGPMMVTKISRPTRVSDVFNIEVHGHHVYRITDNGVLVHNNSSIGRVVTGPVSASEEAWLRKLVDSGITTPDRVADYLRGVDNAAEVVARLKQPALKRRIPGLSGKEAALDTVPSWAKGEVPRVGESGREFAKRLLDAKYGPGNYSTTSQTEFSWLQKFADRAFE